MQKTSLCLTIKNEEDNIAKLIHSINKQSKLPDEVIIVDGGSNDATLEVIKNLEKKVNFAIRLIELPNSTRSEGRNKAISQARFPIVALTDAGCVLDKKWLEEITRPIINNIADVVPGNYRIDTNNLSNFAIIAAYLTLHTPSDPNQNYLASSRSLAVTKKTWMKSGGYPDELNTAEDLVFVNNLKMNKVKHVNAPRAIVYWSPPNEITKIFKTFFMYAYGDGLAGLTSPHAYKYGVKLFLIGTVLFLSAFKFEFGIVLLVSLIIWWNFQAVKLKINSKLPRKIPTLTILTAVISLFWVTFGGYIFGLMMSKVNVRK